MTTSYRQIVRSTSLVGGSQAINILIGIVRGKLLAVLIGPAGIGLAGMFQSAVGWIEVVAGLGLRQAGVRQIAAASGADRPDDVARAALAVRRLSMFSAWLGFALVFLFRRQLAQATFGDQTHADSLGWMSLTLVFGALSGGLGALLQGTRRVGFLALSSIFATLAGSLLGLAPIVAWGERGIAFMHVVGAAAGCAVMYGFARRVPLARIRMGWRETWRESGALLRLGAALMGAGLAGTGGIYLTQVLIARGFGTDGVGLYMAAWTLSGFYVQMILAAMATDFYPRISALAQEPERMNHLVNEQIQVGMLLATPGLLFTLAFAPWMLRLLTSAEFVPATPIVRWLLLAAALRTLSWPLSYMLLAHGRSRLYMAAETAIIVAGLLFLALGLDLWGLDGSGISQSLAGAVAAGAMILMVKWLFGFSLSRAARRVALAQLAAMGIALGAVGLLAPRSGAVVGGLLTVWVSLANLLAIKKLTGLGLLDMVRLLAGKGTHA